MSRVLLVVGYVWPELSSAAGRHMMSLLNLFSENEWRVYFASAAAKTPLSIELSEYGIKSSSIELNSSSFDTLVRELNPLVALFDRFMTEEQYGWRVKSACPNCLCVLDTEDLHSLRFMRELELNQVKESIKGWEMLHRELASIYRSDLSLIISDYERDLLVELYEVPEDLLIHVPFLVNNERKGGLEYSKREHFMAIGNFRHKPNWDAVLYLKAEIWPLIRKQLPEAELHIYGAYLAPKVMQLNNKKEGFNIKGWVDDSKEVMGKARVCLAPLRFGAGLKGKLIEAMECGTPSVTTPVGAEGISGGMLWPGFVAEDSEVFARKAVELYANKTTWNLA